MIELDSCPFCGGAGEYENCEMDEYEKLNVDGNDGMWHHIYCTNCFANGPVALNKETAIKLWNKRMCGGISDK